MTREAYLRKLQKYLRRLPKQDYEDAMDYFEEYFADADEEGQQRLMQELGTPKEAASELMANLLAERREKPRSHAVWIAVLTICAAPIALPLLVALAAVLLAVLVCVLAALVCVFLFALAALLVGVKLVVRGLAALPFSVSGAALICGAGLFAVGLCILLVLLGVYVCKGIRFLIIKLAELIAGRRTKQ